MPIITDDVLLCFCWQVSR